MIAATTFPASATGDNDNGDNDYRKKRKSDLLPSSSLFQGDDSLDDDEEEDFDDIDIITDDDKCTNNNGHGFNAAPPTLASTSSGSSSSELHDNDNDSPPLQSNYTLPNNNNNNNNHYHQITPPIPSNTHHYRNNNYNSSSSSSNNIGKSITPLHNIPYVHGGYAAAAPLFITHSKFATVLKRLLPGAYLELKDLLGKSTATTAATHDGGYDNSGGGEWSGNNDLLQRYSLDNDLIIHSSDENDNEENELPYDWNNSSKQQQPQQQQHGKIKGTTNKSTIQQQQRGVTMTDPVKIMKWAENNPIVSAFGIWNSDNGRRTKKFMQGVVVVQNNNGEKNSEGGDDGIGIDEGGADNEGGERMNLLLRSLSSSAVDPSAAAAASGGADHHVEFVQHHDRGNSSVVEAVMTTTGGSSTNTPSDSTQQRLMRHRQRLNQQQQQQQSKQRQRKRDANNSSPLPPLPPSSSLTSSSRNLSGSSYGGYSPPPPSTLPPGSKLLKGGGISGIGGVSSPRRKVPLPSDLPNTSTSSSGVVGNNNQDGLLGLLGYPSVDHSLLTRSRSLSFDSNNHQLSTSLHLLPTVVENQLLPSSKQQEKQHYNKPALEWDIFLDPSLVRRVDMALHTVDTLEIQLRKIRMKRDRLRQQKLKERRLRGVTTSLEDVDSEDDDDVDDDEDFDLLQSHTAAQVEVDRLVAQLMRRTIIAHGSMSQLVLEATGWAPGYNFGRVVKSSREGTNLPSPKRRGGDNNKDLPSLSFTEALSWDEEEEQRDFEALLDRKMMGAGGSATGAAGSNTNSAKSGTHHSKGMFMEKWLSLFAKSLSLLVRSTNTSSSSDDMEDDNDIVKLSSSSSSNSTRRKRAQDDMLVTKKEKKSATKKAEEEKGLTSYFSSFFFSSEKSKNSVNPDEDSDNDQEEEDAANINDVDASAYLTINDMFSPATTKKSTGILGGLSCGMSLCLGMDDDFICGASAGQTSNSVFPLNPHASHQMARDIQRIHDVLGEPLRLVLDLKSRRVPPRVWSRLIDNLRSRGLIVEGIGSFDMDELRVIGKGCSYPLTPILFFHSVGDLQRACHANEVKKGDTVYFNGGSLMWKRSSIMEAAECNACCGIGQMNDLDDDENDVQANTYDRTSSTATIATTTSARALNASGKYSFQPYAYPRSALSDWERVMCKSTIEDYRRHFDLKIGVYVQEFSISAEALDELTVFVNQHGDLYDQGLSFGGVNGVAVKNISGDGYWNQRYMGRSWDFNARPSREMTPLKPEDHHLVQVAIQAGAWGQVGTIYEVNDEQPGALTVPPPREPCKPVHW